MRFDFEETFGEDYLYFYAPMLTDEWSDTETRDIIGFLHLEPGDRVLDAPCGHGRLTRRLAAQGMQVVGVDASDVFLDVARSTDPAGDYRKGDLRSLPVDGPFDAVVSWFTSFGYFEDPDNKQVLAEYRRVLRDGGTLLIETMNRDEIVRRFTRAPASHGRWIGDDALIDTTDIDCMTGRLETDRVTIRNGVVRRSHHSVRIPTIPEFREWLAAAGFTGAEFTARNGQVPSLDNPRLIVRATA